MPKQGLAGVWQSMQSLWREQTPLVRTCLFVGIAIGFLLGINHILGLPADYGRPNKESPVEFRTFVLPRISMVAGISILGGVVGTALGVTTELVFREKKESDQNKPWYRRGKSRRKR
jgi:hypothetical protein